MQTDVIYNHDLISLRCERSWVERESRLFLKSASILASLGLAEICDGRFFVVARPVMRNLERCVRLCSVSIE